MAEYLRNTWYMAGWADELPAGTTLARTIAEQPLVLYRGVDGAAACLLDRCPHRFAPLSMGRVEGSSIRCNYHGLRFAASGACVENPHGALVSSLRVAAFPLVERYDILWVWLGAAEIAEPGEIPDLSFIERTPPTAFTKGYLPTRAHHLLLVDNILDLTHADYLHPDSLGGGSITRSKAAIEPRPGSCLLVRWLAQNEAPLPIQRRSFPAPDARVDMWTEVLWHPCGVMILTVGATPTGRPRTEGIESCSAHIMTPEAATSTHYFYCNTRNFKTGSQEVTAATAAALRHAFENEDKPMIEAQQRRIGAVDLLELGPALQKSDAASVRARRLLARAIADERQPAQAR